ncbi:MAG: hypothetical protein V4723_07275 [Pseudomonadota bacterium]
MLAWTLLSLRQKISAIFLAAVLLFGSFFRIEDATSLAVVVQTIAGLLCAFAFLLNPICFIESSKSIWSLDHYPPLCRFLIFAGVAGILLAGVLFVANWSMPA